MRVGGRFTKPSATFGDESWAAVASARLGKVRSRTSRTQPEAEPGGELLACSISNLDKSCRAISIVETCGSVAEA